MKRKTTTVTKNGRTVPVDDWMENNMKKLRIRLDLADTEEERRAISGDIETLKAKYAIFTSNNPAETARKLLGPGRRAAIL